MTPRVLAIAGGVALVVAVVLAAVGDGTADGIAIALGGLGAVAVTSATFWAVGRSEDRAREQERRP
jgi:ABC-type enterobactin transport system permease subunit